jgi:hypothetical protein
MSRDAPEQPARFQLGRALSGLGALGVLAASRAYAPYATTGPVLCPFHGLFGLPCPGCGLTRAFCSLAHGDIAAAVGHHALSPLLFLATLATPLVCGYELARRRPSRLSRSLESPALGWGVGIVFGAHHLLRTVLWAWDGTLLHDYVATSWSYALLTSLGVLT